MQYNNSVKVLEFLHYNHNHHHYYQSLNLHHCLFRRNMNLHIHHRQNHRDYHLQLVHGNQDESLRLRRTRGYIHLHQYIELSLIHI